MSTRLFLSTVFVLLVCTRIKWSRGAYIGSSSHDEPAYYNGPNGLERDFRDTPAFKIQQSYVADEEDKRGEEDLLMERPTLRVGNSQSGGSSSNQLLPA